MERPRFATVRDYGARLSDAAFWTPYVTPALARHALPLEPVEAPPGGAVGTYPTFLVGRYVVKLFGPRFAGGEGFAVERALHTLFRDHPEIPAPVLVAAGTLFDGPLDGGAPWTAEAPEAGAEAEATWPWPYLITTRLDGRPWREAPLAAGEREALAGALGRVVRAVHALPPPAELRRGRNALEALRAGCVERHRRWGSLPASLVEQIEPYLAGTPGLGRAGRAACVVHADLHADHLFVAPPAAAPGAGARLVGIIDWGDAIAGDPYYELPALHLGTFGGDKRLLRAFLEGYGWPADPDFARRAMAMSLLHEFDVLDDARRLIERRAPRGLDELAALLWAIE